MDNSPNVNLPYIAAAQSQKHVTHNEALKLLDALVQGMVLDRTLTVAPTLPANGARYIVAAGATGIWAGQTGEIAAFQDGAWAYLTPQTGWLFFVANESRFVAWNGSAWVLPVSDGVNPVSLLGINTLADTTNRLAVKADASLFDNAGAGHQAKLNKASAGNTASLLFQTAYSGRAELGLSGDDNFHFKVSADGNAWFEALDIDRTSGRVTFPNTSSLGAVFGASGAGHAAGLVPDPGATAGATKFLREDGSFAVPVLSGSAFAPTDAPAFTTSLSLQASGAAGVNAFGIASNSDSLGFQKGQYRTYFDQFGMLQTQGNITVSGAFNTLGAGKIALVAPGGTKNSPSAYLGNRINGSVGGKVGISNDLVGPNLLSQDNSILTMGQVATSAAVVFGGNGYKVGDVLTLSGGIATAATLTRYDSVRLGGSGYVAGDVVTVVGGVGTPATLTITATDSSGAVTNATLLTAGNYSVLPAIADPVSGGAGTSFFPNMIWPTAGATLITVTAVAAGAITAVSISRPGLYTSIPNGPANVTGGAGSAATFALAWSPYAQQSRHYECLDYTQAIVFQVRGDGALAWGMSGNSGLGTNDIDVFVGNTTNLYPLDRASMASDAHWTFAGIKSTADNTFGNLQTRALIRALPTTPNMAVDIGTFSLVGDPLGAGAGALRIYLTTTGSGCCVSKIFDMVTIYNATNDVWATVFAGTTTGPSGGFDFSLEAKQSLTALSLRLRTVASSGPANAYITILQHGAKADSFSPSTAVNAVSVPTLLFLGQAPVLRVVQTKQNAAPATSGVVAIGAGVPYQFIDPTGTLATLTVTLPGNPLDGQIQRIIFGQAVTALTLNAAGAIVTRPPTSAAQDQFFEFQYNAGSFNWRRTG